jgi:hypothetical protein
MKKQTKIALGVGITLLLGYGIYHFLRQPKPKIEENEEDIVEGCKFPETPCFNDNKKCYNPFSFNQNDGISKCYNL